jgi:hypothetical protein
LSTSTFQKYATRQHQVHQNNAGNASLTLTASHLVGVLEREGAHQLGTVVRLPFAADALVVVVVTAAAVAVVVDAIRQPLST